MKKVLLLLLACSFSAAAQDWAKAVKDSAAKAD